jgi:hypothetical protein
MRKERKDDVVIGIYKIKIHLDIPAYCDGDGNPGWAALSFLQIKLSSNVMASH